MRQVVGQRLAAARSGTGCRGASWRRAPRRGCRGGRPARVVPGPGGTRPCPRSRASRAGWPGPWGWAGRSAPDRTRARSAPRRRSGALASPGAARRRALGRLGQAAGDDPRRRHRAAPRLRRRCRAPAPQRPPGRAEAGCGRLQRGPPGAVRRCDGLGGRARERPRPAAPGASPPQRLPGGRRQSPGGRAGPRAPTTPANDRASTRRVRSSMRATDVAERRRARPLRVAASVAAAAASLASRSRTRSRCASSVLGVGGAELLLPLLQALDRRLPLLGVALRHRAVEDRGGAPGPRRRLARGGGRPGLAGTARRRAPDAVAHARRRRGRRRSCDAAGRAAPGAAPARARRSRTAGPSRRGGR